MMAKRGGNMYYIIIINNHNNIFVFDDVFINYNLYPSKRDVPNRVGVFDRPVSHYITFINNTARTSNCTAHPHYTVHSVKTSQHSRLQHITSHFALFEILSAALLKNQIFHAEITDKQGALFASANFFRLVGFFSRGNSLKDLSTVTN